MWKRCPCRPSQSWPCMIIHDLYWIIKYANIPFSLSSPRSFDHFFDVNFCFKIRNLGIMWHSPRRELSRLSEPKRLHQEKLSRLPELPYLPRRDNSPTCAQKAKLTVNFLAFPWVNVLKFGSVVTTHNSYKIHTLFLLKSVRANLIYLEEWQITEYWKNRVNNLDFYQFTMTDNIISMWWQSIKKFHRRKV